MGHLLRTGGCFCGAVRYRVSAPANETVHCHCSMCRKTHGAMFATFSSVPTEAFWIEQGNDQIGCFENLPGNGRYFCTGCGCQIYSVIPSEPGSVYFATATLELIGFELRPREGRRIKP